MPHRRLRRQPGTIRCEQLERRDCPAAMFSLELPQQPILEGDTPSFTVRLSERSSRPERVLISTVSESATLGRDYFLRNNVQLLFAPGETVKTFSIQTYADNLAEGNETFRLVATPTNRPASQQLSSAVRIWDVVPTSLTVTGGSIVEGNDGRKNATFELTLTGSPLLPVTVQYATRNGTATAGTDYEAVTGSLTFVPDRNSIPAPTQYKKTVTVPIIGDLVLEADETFMLVVSNPTRGTTIRTPETVFTIRNDEIDQPGFQIVVNFDGTVSDARKRVFEAAANRWGQIITGDLPGVTVGGIFVDDVVIDASFPAIDGVGGVLGEAGPRAYRTEGAGLPYRGAMAFDSADVARLEQTGQLQNVILHEMAHVLGFGVLWIDNDLLQGTTTDPVYVGANATREYNALFGLTGNSVPVEAGGGPGTAFSHWRESVLRNELMTGFLDSGSANPISRITVGQFEDIGYTVDYSKADSYPRPAAAATAQILKIATRSTVAVRGPAMPARQTTRVPSTASRIVSDTVRQSTFVGVENGFAATQVKLQAAQGRTAKGNSLPVPLSKFSALAQTGEIS